MEDFITTFVTETHVVYADISAYLNNLDLFLQWELEETQAEMDLDLEDLEDLQ